MSELFGFGEVMEFLDACIVAAKDAEEVRLERDEMRELAGRVDWNEWVDTNEMGV